jgi:ribosomal protein L37AE/L43A
MARYGKGTFGSGIELNAQIVNGRCPFCTTDGIFVSVHKTIFRCITCGSDIEQKINGKISYIPANKNVIFKKGTETQNGKA